VLVLTAVANSLLVEDQQMGNQEAQRLKSSRRVAQVREMPAFVPAAACHVFEGAHVAG
jgi:hypothetical protein